VLYAFAFDVSHCGLLTKLDCGLSRLYSADDDLLQWLAKELCVGHIVVSRCSVGTA